jgi:zinc transporter ZupT
LGVSTSVWGVIFGMLVGLVFILISERILSKHKDLQRQHFSGASAKKMLLIVGIMFLHSFTEGIAIGV